MLMIHALGLALVSTLAGCVPSAGWATDVTATSLDDDRRPCPSCGIDYSFVQYV